MRRVGWLIIGAAVAFKVWRGWGGKGVAEVCVTCTASFDMYHCETGPRGARWVGEDSAVCVEAT